MESSIKNFSNTSYRYNILIIENSKVLNNILVNTFKDETYETFSSFCLEDANKIIENNRIDFIILDMNLPDGDSFELIKKLEGSHEKIFVLTRKNNILFKELTYQKGIIGFIFKAKDFFISISTIPKTIKKIEKNRFKTILITVESSIIRKQLKVIFENRYYQVRMACNIKETKKIVLEHKIDQILLFTSLGKENGLELLKKYKKEIIHIQKIPVIILSENDSSIRREALRLGAIDIINIPYILEELILKVDFWIEYKRKDYEVVESKKLLEQYKNAVDKSSIVSKIDINGYITYVNDYFCELTAFSREELIGYKHKGVDVLTSLDIQKSLEINNIWKGIINNKTKEKKDYWLNVTILPLENVDGKVIEYIIIMQDITNLFELHKDIEDTQRELLYKMGEVGESRSKETGNHVKRVSKYSKELAILVGLSDSDAQTLYTASPMHDIGKVGIADAILKKPGKLSFEEFEIMKTHSEIGYNILKDSNNPIIKAASIIALTHHEKWDGSGYPKALKAENIHIFGRITAVADVFDALGSDRIYKKAWKDEDIIKLFKEEKGKHFDPNLINLFLNNLDNFIKIRNDHSE